MMSGAQQVQCKTDRKPADVHLKNTRIYIYIYIFCYLSFIFCFSLSVDPCLNGGSCVDEVGSFSCECRPGFEGVHCKTEVNECASQPCRNGAICKDYVNSFVCECQPGFDGILCDHNILECTERWGTELPIFVMHFLKMMKLVSLS